MQPGVKCFMFNPQFSTERGFAAPWDYGKAGIEEFVDNHRCTRYCRHLHLVPLNEPQALPPRPKPKPAVKANSIGVAKDGGDGGDGEDGEDGDN